MQRRVSLLTSVWLILGAATPGCSQPKPVADTMTNEQGCVRKRQMGPQDPSAMPPPLMEACLGPYKLKIPANYFDDQMGPYFDGSFSLNLEYPDLNAFAPGERSNLKLDVSTRTVAISYRYLDRVEPDERLRVEYMPSPEAGNHDAPSDRLDMRIKGEPIHGLTPYYPDMARIVAYYQAKGYSPSLRVMQAEGQDDWYVDRSDDGIIRTIIKCTSREVADTGVEYRQGKMVRSKEDKLPMCKHMIMLPDQRIAIDITYVRAALPEWRRIQARATEALKQFSAADQPVFKQ
jgi:hypothetical protein